jgi:chaperonin GroEL (HSP60 family)
MIELSKSQDEEVGDGTTSVIILGAHQGSEQHLYIYKANNWFDFCSW